MILSYEIIFYYVIPINSLCFFRVQLFKKINESYNIDNLKIFFLLLLII